MTAVKLILKRFFFDGSECLFILNRRYLQVLLSILYKDGRFCQVFGEIHADIALFIWNDIRFFSSLN